MGTTSIPCHPLAYDMQQSGGVPNVFVRHLAITDAQECSAGGDKAFDGRPDGRTISLCFYAIFHAYTFTIQTVLGSVLGH